ncbi:MAG: glycosyltransferase family 4 protein [Vitreimonas sp.]
MSATALDRARADVPLRPGRVVFCATGISGTHGGIASANRNVVKALRRLAAEKARDMHTYVLHEDLGGDETYRGFGGGKAAFAFAAWRGAAGAGLAVFDHVRLALPILALPKPARGPVVICAHGSESWRRVRRSSIAAFRAADLVLANSAYTLTRMQERFNAFNGAACPLGLPPHFALNPSPPPRAQAHVSLRAANGAECKLGPRVMLTVARMDAGEQEKGHRELIAALPSVLAHLPTAQLVFVGGGSDAAALRQLAAASPAAAHICFAGQVADADLDEFYRAAYAYVMPSRQEGFGLAYLEAMNHALPCVACRDDGGADVVVEGETGLLVSQPIEQEQLVSTLIRILSDEAMAREMGVAGWRRLNAHFSAEAHQARVLALVAPLLR